MSKQVGYGVFGLSLVLLGVLIVVPYLKRTFPQYYSEGFSDATTLKKVNAKKSN